MLNALLRHTILIFTLKHDGLGLPKRQEFVAMLFAVLMAIMALRHFGFNPASEESVSIENFIFVIVVLGVAFILLESQSACVLALVLITVEMVSFAGDLLGVEEKNILTFFTIYSFYCYWKAIRAIEK